MAHRAITANRQIGLLLPCNVVVRSDPNVPENTIVEAMNPQLLVDVTDEPQLQPVAQEVADKLKAAIAALTS